MGLFVSKKGEPSDWKGFQKHMGYTDEELEAFKNDPRKAKHIQKVCSPEMQNKWLIVEVVESHGCENGLKVGDRLYFEGLSLLDTKRSSRWCPHAMGVISWFANGARDLFMQGTDPNNIYADHFGCFDAGSKYGYGRILMKTYVVDKSELDKLG